MMNLVLAAALSCPPAEIRICDKCTIDPQELLDRITKVEAVCKWIGKDMCLVWFHMYNHNPPQFSAHCKQVPGAGDER